MDSSGLGQNRLVDIFNLLKPSGYFLYHNFSIKKFYIFPTVYRYLTTNTDFWPNWFSEPRQGVFTVRYERDL